MFLEPRSQSYPLASSTVNPVAHAERHLATPSEAANEAWQDMADEQSASVIRAAMQTMPKYMRTPGVIRGIAASFAAFIAESPDGHRDCAKAAVEHCDFIAAEFEEGM